jgi:hypothetical protein
VTLKWAGHITVTLSLFAIPTWSHPAPSNPSPMVSIVSLIANPTKYAGKPIQTLGFLCIAEEEETIYLNEQDYLHGLYSNSIDLRLTESQRELAKALNLKYVIVEGTVSSQGERADWPIPKLVSIHRLDEWKHHRQPPPK